jgi:hypothetical protein
MVATRDKEMVLITEAEETSITRISIVAHS